MHAYITYIHMSPPKILGTKSILDFFKVTYISIYINIYLLTHSLQGNMKMCKVNQNSV